MIDSHLTIVQCVYFKFKRIILLIIMNEMVINLK